MSSSLRKHGASKLIWLLMALLMLGLGGFGISNFGSMGADAIGQVGNRDVTAADYARAFQAEQRALSAQVGRPVTAQEAQAMGIASRVQSQLFSQAALDDEADRLGVSVGDAEVARQIAAIPAFKGLDGKFSAENYKLALRQEGYTEAGFEREVRANAARGLLMGAITGAVASPAGYAETIAAWAGETRDFTAAELLPSDLAEAVPAATDAEIQAWYDAHPDAYMRPETRKITYVWLSPEMIQDDIKLDEAALQQAYQKRIAEFVTPEKRLVERLVYPTEAEALAARGRLDKGEATFADLATERGLTLADADLGEVSKADLGAAGDAVFALTEPGPAGPVATDLGPALFQMNGIIDARNVSLEEARPELEGEARLDQARRQVADQMTPLQDLLASGATLEDVAKETKMELGTIDLAPDTDSGIAAYSDFRDAAAKATEQDFPTLLPLDDGGVFALRLDKIEPAARRPLDEVRDEVGADWQKAETRKRLVALADSHVARVEGGQPLASTGLVATQYRGVTRRAFVEGLDPAAITRVFALEPGKAAVAETADKVIVLELQAVHPADPASDDQKQIRARLEPQVAQTLAGDMLELYTRAIEAEVGVRIDPAGMAAANARLR